MGPLIAAVLFALAATPAPAVAAEPVAPNDFAPEQEAPLHPEPAQPQPAPSELRSGLAVHYWDVFVRDIKEIAALVGRREAAPGPPLAKIDSQAGGGPALTRPAQRRRRRRDPRLHPLRPCRNLALHRQHQRTAPASPSTARLLLEDPDVHGDRMTNWADVVVAEPGWYRLHVLYFERKGTSTLQLFWKEPGAADYNRSFRRPPSPTTGTDAAARRPRRALRGRAGPA